MKILIPLTINNYKDFDLVGKTVVWGDDNRGLYAVVRKGPLDQLWAYGWTIESMVKHWPCVYLVSGV